MNRSKTVAQLGGFVELPTQSPDGLASQLATVMAKFLSSFGNALSPAVRAMHARDPLWWCLRNGDFSSSAHALSPCPWRDTSIGRFRLVLETSNLGLLADAELAAVADTETSDLLLHAIARLVERRPLAGFVLQVLIRCARPVDERELEQILAAQGRRAEVRWSALDWSVVRRALLALCAVQVGGEYMLRRATDRDPLLDLVVKRCGCPRLVLDPAKLAGAALPPGVYALPAAGAGPPIEKLLKARRSQEPQASPPQRLRRTVNGSFRGDDPIALMIRDP